MEKITRANAQSIDIFKMNHDELSEYIKELRTKFGMTDSMIKYHLFEKLENDKAAMKYMENFSKKLFRENFKEERYLKPEDIFANAREALLTGDRAWDLEKEPDIRQVMFYTMKSEFNNFRNKHKENLFDYDEDEESNFEAQINSIEGTEELLYEFNEINILSSYKDESDVRKVTMLSKVKKLLIDDDRYQDFNILKLHLDGYKRSEISKLFNISVNEVTKANKRNKDFLKNKKHLIVNL